MEARVEETEFLRREFLACVSCHWVIPLIPPEVKEEIESKTLKVFIEEDDFMASHKYWGQSHKIVNLRVVDFFSEQPYFEPVRKGWYQTQSEKGEKFIVKESRTNIEEPFVYELFTGRIKRGVEEISLQEDNMYKQLKWEKSEWPDKKIEETIEIIKGVFEIEQESILDKLNKQFGFLEKNGFLATTNHPLRFLLGLSPEFVNLLRQSVRPICNPEEWTFVSDFIEQNKDVNGILALKVKMKFTPIISK